MSAFDPKRTWSLMRIEGLIVSGLLLLALVPSLFRAWRNVLIASGCVLALVHAGFVWTLLHFRATSAEGPAVVGLAILIGLMVFVVTASCAIRLVISVVLNKLPQPRAVRFRRVLMGIGVALAGLAVVGAQEFSVRRGFAITVGSASAWLVLVAWLTRVNSIKPSPFLGVA